MTGTVAAPWEAKGLLDAVRALRETVAGTAFPLPTSSAPAATRTRDELVHQLDDYVLPRLTSLDAPLLAVVGGSTGAGKSTLVNAVVGERVTLPGVLRPTTRSPVLVHAPDDASWFADDRVLPALHRVTGADAVEGVDALRLVAAPSLPAGLALVDAPDIDSVVAANRALSRQLLAAADLWIFVTTAARYADAVPWDLLHQARERGTALAVVLDRVPAPAVEEIRDHLASMLQEQGLGGTPLFTVVEGLGDEGALPPEQVGRLRSWLVALAHDQHARHEVVRQTLQGALSSLDPRVAALAGAAREQDAAVAELHDVAATAFAAAGASVADGMRDGRLLRGEVLARWQEFVGTGEFFKQVETGVSRLRDRLVGALTGRADRADGLGDALHGGVATLVRAEAQGAVSGTVSRWRALPGGGAVLEADPTLLRTSDDLVTRVESLVHDWQGDVLELVRTEGQDRRTRARVAAYGVNALGTVLILVTLATTGGLTTAEVGIAGGTALLGQRLLEAIFGDQAVRTLAERARRALVARVEALYAQEQGRYDAAVAALAVGTGQDEALSARVAAVGEAR